jgi:isoleucyl-tRNA synthetase
MAPISPFFTDWLFRNLNGCACTHNATSVHHTDWPEVVQAAIDPSLEERMKLAQDISSLVLSVRKKVRGPGQQGSQTGIKVRQPLQKILIPVSDEHTKEQIERVSALIRHEVNVKEIRYLSDTEGFIHKKIRPDYKALGKKLGPKMKAVALKVAAFSRQDIALMEKQGYYDLGMEDGPLRIGLDEVEITSEDIPGWSVANKGPLTIALDTTLTPELEEEGIARELINRIQRLRKDQGFELTDRIIVKLSESEPLKSAIIHFNTYICTEILADAFETVPELEAGTEIEVNDIKLNVLVLKNK